MIHTSALAIGLFGIVCMTATAPRADGFGEAVARPEDVTTIQTCLGTGKLPAERRRCIGLVSDPCRAAPLGQSTMGTEACLSREYVAWDHILNAAYRNAITQFDEAGTIYLRDTQKAWIAYRDQSCRWPSLVFPRGTIAGPLSGGCLVDETANRTLTLLEIAEWLAPH